jgi:hypothetical protein
VYTEAKTDRVASLSIFVTLLFSYAYFFGGSGFNQNTSLAVARAIVEHQGLQIEAYATSTMDISFSNGHMYSNKVPGLSAIVAVPYWFLHAIQGVPGDPLKLTLYLYICTVFACGVSGALIGVLLYKAARHRGLPPLGAYSVAMLTGLGTPLFAYSTMLFPHVPAALFVLLAFLLLDGTLRRSPTLAGVAIGAAVLMNYVYIVLPVVFLIYLIVTSRDRLRDTLRFIAGGLPLALLLGWYQAIAFGSPFRTAINTENPGFLSEGAWMGIFYPPQPAAIWGITFSPFRGFFYIAPLMILGAVGVARMSRVSMHRAASGLIAGAAGILFFVNSCFNGWHGGYTIGARYALPLVPLFAIGLMFLSGKNRLLFSLFAAISLLFNFAATAVDPQPPQTLYDPIGRYELPALFTGKPSSHPSVPKWMQRYSTGHTSTNRVAADELLPFTRHAPGSRESEWASFNLGEYLFGAGSFASILPYLGIVLTLVSATIVYVRRPHLRTERSPEAVEIA